MSVVRNPILGCVICIGLAVSSQAFAQQQFFTVSDIGATRARLAWSTGPPPATWTVTIRTQAGANVAQFNVNPAAATPITGGGQAFSVWTDQGGGVPLDPGGNYTVTLSSSAFGNIPSNQPLVTPTQSSDRGLQVSRDRPEIALVTWNSIGNARGYQISVMQKNRLVAGPDNPLQIQVQSPQNEYSQRTQIPLERDETYEVIVAAPAGQLRGTIPPFRNDPAGRRGGPNGGMRDDPFARQRARLDSVSFGRLLRAEEFLVQKNREIKFLIDNPESAIGISRTFVPDIHGRDAGTLIAWMNGRGMTFAKPLAGDESAYQRGFTMMQELYALSGAPVMETPKTDLQVKSPPRKKPSKSSPPNMNPNLRLPIPARKARIGLRGTQ